MMEKEIILPKEKLNMAAENVTNAATLESAETIIKEAVCDDNQHQDGAAEISTEPPAAVTPESLEEHQQLAEDIVTEDPKEENLEEKLTAAIAALERNLEETIKEGIKTEATEELPANAIRGILKDEEIEEPQENPGQPDPRAGKVRATPAARRIAREFKVELDQVIGSGPKGRIETDDVKKLVVIQPGSLNYKSKEPVVIKTNLEKIAGNPSNLFSTPVKLEEVPEPPLKPRKKLRDMNQKTEKLPNPELDFVPFVDENDDRLKVQDVDVVTKISELDFVPFVDLKAEPLREEIIVKPTPMHVLYENEEQDQAFINRKSRGLPKRTPSQDQYQTKAKAPISPDQAVVKAVDSEVKTSENKPVNSQITELVKNQPEDLLPETDQPEFFETAATDAEKVEPLESHADPVQPAQELIQQPENVNNEQAMADQNDDENDEKDEKNLEKIIAPTLRPKAIRKYLVKSTGEVPVISLTTEIDMTEIKDLRKKITKKIEEQAKYRCTYTDFLLLATSRALIKHPLINARREVDQVVVHDHVNIGLTVESESGFIVSVIPNSQTMSFVEIVKSRGDLLKAVKNKHLPEDQEAATTFTITNLGMYGIREFTAIINQTNSAILSVGEVVQRIRIHQGEPVVRSVMKISLNLDQRVANGVDGAKFLQDIKADMENPPLLLF